MFQRSGWCGCCGPASLLTEAGKNQGDMENGQSCKTGNYQKVCP